MTSKRWISLLLVICMLSSMLLMPAQAAGSDPAEKENGDITIPFETTEPEASVPETTEATEPEETEPPANIVESGSCGENVTWTLDDEGTLTISGTGAMYDYNWENKSPFYYRSDIRKVVFGDGVTTVGQNAFETCENLAELSFAPSVSAINEYAFYCCYGLRTVTIPVGLKALAINAFDSCYSLQKYTVAAGNEYFSADDSGVLFNADKTRVVKVPYPITVYEIPAGVTTIGKAAFSDSRLTSVEIPEGVETIEMAAFGSCYSLTEIKIPDSVTTIAENVFMYDEGLTKVEIGTGLTYLGGYAFYGCSALTDITIANDNAYIDCDAFYNCAWFDALPDGVVYVGNCLYTVKGTCPENVVIQPGTVHISDSAFLRCDTLVSVVIPEGVTQISQYAFQYCEALETVTIPASVTTICDSAFSNCEALKNVYFGGSRSQWEAITVGEWNYYLENVENVYCALEDMGPEIVETGSCGENVTWTLDVEGTLTVSGEGPMADYGYGYDPGTPSYYGLNFKKIVIEEGVTSIGHWAFAQSSVEEAVIPSSVKKISKWAFIGCASLKSVEIPEGVEIISYQAFAETGLTSVNIPASVYELDMTAFDSCNSLTGIWVSEYNNNYSSDSYGVLHSKYGLELIKAPGTLTSYTVTEYVYSIGDRAFYGCKNLADLHIPDQITSIGGEALHETAWYDAQPEGVVYAGKVLYSVKGECPAEVVIADGTKGIAVWAFNFMENLTSVTIPASVKKIGRFAFNGTGVTAVNYGGTQMLWEMIDIEHGNNMLTGANIQFAAPEVMESGSCGENLTWTLDTAGTLTISGTGAMTDYTYYEWQEGEESPFSRRMETIRNIVIESGVTAVGSFAFRGCYRAKSVTIADTVTSIGEYAFYDCSGLQELQLPSQLAYLGDLAFSYCDGITEVTIPGTVTYFGGYAFGRCDNLQAVYLTDGITKISEEAFAFCNNLETVMIPETVERIEYMAFYQCRKITYVQLPEGLLAIGDSAFEYCEQLADVNIPEGIMEAGYAVFWNTPWYEAQPEGMFYLGKVAAEYKGECPETITLKKGTVAIAGSAFENCDQLVSIVIPEGVTSIGEWAFNDCDALTSVTMPSTVKKVSFRTFAGCPNLKQIDLPEGLEGFNMSTFSESGLTSVKIPSTVTEITYNVFTDCADLKTVTIPSSVKKIDSEAFYGCEALESVYFSGTQEQWDAIEIRYGNDPLLNAKLYLDGFFTEGGNTYYSENGKRVTGWKTIAGKTYYFKVGTGGTMAKGWTTIGGQKYYFKQADGTMVTGNVLIGGVPNEFTAKGVWVREIPAPAITKQPVSAKAGEKQTVTVSLTATGEGLTYKWFYKNKADTKFTQTIAFTGNTYSVEMTAARSGRQLYCVIGDKYGRSVQTNTVTISMAAAPKITKQPVSAKVAKGVTASTTVTATGEGLKYTWYVQNPGATTWVKSSITKSTYSFAMDAAKSGRKVYCVVTDKYGQTVKSSTVTLSMAAAPKITKQPVSVKVANGKNLTVSFTASGEGLTYKWYYKNKSASAFTYTSTFKSNSYTTTMDATRSGRQLYCVVTDKYGQTVQTNTVTISMAAAPKITKQPVSVKVAKGKTASVSVTATGEGLTYTWYVQNPGATTWVKSSITKSTYAFAMDAAKSGRKVYCVVTDKYGQTVKSSTVTLSMAAAPKITKQPASVKVANGATAKVTLTASGEGLTYKWYYKNKGASAFTYTSTFKSNTYTTTMDATRSGRQLYCVVTDKYGQTVKTVTVTISMAAAPKITKQPVSVKVANGATAAVSFTASGEGLTYKWYYKDKGASTFTLTTSFKSNTYSVAMTAARSGRQLYCVVTDKYGQTVKTNTVTISMK